MNKEQEEELTEACNCVEPPMAEQEDSCSCGAQRQKHRDEAEFKDLIHRLNRMEGQIRGIKNMVEGDCYCVDILTQISAVQSALGSFSRKLLGNHIRTCVAEDIRTEKDGAIEELLDTLRKIMK